MIWWVSGPRVRGGVPRVRAQHIAGRRPIFHPYGCGGFAGPEARSPSARPVAVCVPHVGSARCPPATPWCRRAPSRSLGDEVQALPLSERWRTTATGGTSPAKPRRHVKDAASVRPLSLEASTPRRIPPVPAGRTCVWPTGSEHLFDTVEHGRRNGTQGRPRLAPRAHPRHAADTGTSTPSRSPSGARSVEHQALLGHGPARPASGPPARVAPRRLRLARARRQAGAGRRLLDRGGGVGAGVAPREHLTNRQGRSRATCGVLRWFGPRAR